MKKLLLLITTIGLLTACKGDDEAPDPGNYQTPLPEATQNGKGTFACYVDGMAYIVEKHQINSYYQYTQDYYAFVVNGVKKTKPIFSIVIGSSAEALIEGNTYSLNKDEKGKQWGGIGFVYEPDIPFTDTYTNGSTYKGELTITKLDLQSQIISGTFWFDVKDPKTGETRKVRDGRFDVVANF